MKLRKGSFQAQLRRGGRLEVANTLTPPFQVVFLVIPVPVWDPSDMPTSLCHLETLQIRPTANIFYF